MDKYGRFMLLTGLLLKEQKEEGIFASVRKKNSFISLVNDMISDMKQYDVTPSELAEIESSLNDDSVLCEKISDVREIYEKYEELLAGRYLDSEDFLRIVSEKIRGSELVKSHRFLDRRLRLYDAEAAFHGRSYRLYPRRKSMLSLLATTEMQRDSSRYFSV